MFSWAIEEFLGTYRQVRTARVHYKNTPIQIYWKFHHQKFSNKNADIFHIFAQNIDCGYLLEPPCQGGSNDYPQSMFLIRNKKNNVYPCKPKFNYIKVGFKGVKLYRYVFVMKTSHRCLGQWSFTPDSQLLRFCYIGGMFSWWPPNVTFACSKVHFYIIYEEYITGIAICCRVQFSYCHLYLFTCIIFSIFSVFSPTSSIYCYTQGGTWCRGAIIVLY